MINFLLNFAVLRYYFTALKPGDSFGGDGVFFMVMLSWSETSQRRFFGTLVPQNDNKKMCRMTNSPYLSC